MRERNQKDEPECHRYSDHYHNTCYNRTSKMPSRLMPINPICVLGKGIGSVESPNHAASEGGDPLAS